MSPAEYNETLLIGLNLAAIGMGVVFTALVAITLIVANFDRVDQWLHRGEAEEAAPAPASDIRQMPMTAPEPVADGISPQIIAAVSAAVNEAVSKKVRITRIRYRERPAPAWHVQGRATIMNRHVGD